MTVISLSSIPPRFDLIGLTLETLLAQKADIREIRLYIPRTYRRFPDYDGAAPKVPKGITVIRCETDLGPASKVLFCARDLRGTDTPILFCDDDRDYPADWAGALIAEAARYPDRAICLQGRRISKLGFAEPEVLQDAPRAVEAPRHLFDAYRWTRIKQQLGNLILRRRTPKPPKAAYLRSGMVDYFCGFQGVIVRADWFDDLAFDIPKILWAVDDVWLSGHVARKGIPIWAKAVVPTLLPPVRNDVHLTSPLVTAVIDDHARDDADRACVRYMQDTYGIWR